MQLTEKIHNLFYKTTNTVNGKYYYGIHSTNNLGDGYLGSGLVLKKAIKKYGKENFSKQIIADYSTRKEASDHEARVVTLELIKLEECYNSKAGGDVQCGENHPMFGKKGLNNPRYGQKHSKEAKDKMTLGRLGEKNHFFGKRHSKETKIKMGEKSKGRHVSEETLIKYRNKPSCKRCSIFEIEYILIAGAAKQLKLSESTVSFRIKSKNELFKDWTYI